MTAGREVFVAVPSFNHARFVERTLGSIFNQTHAPKTLLVIDDGSTDDSPRVIERVLKDCPFASELVVRENRGLCRTLNEALAHATTPFFAYLGSDDLWRPEFLARRTELLEKRPAAALAYGHGAIVAPDDRIVDSSENWAKYIDGDPTAMLLRGGAPLSSTVLYRTAALQNVGGWNEDFALEDYELYLRLVGEGEFAFDAGPPLAAWRRHAANTSREAEFMLAETLRAQRLTASRLGLDAPALARANAELSWTYAEQLSRRGAHGRAFELARKHWRAAPDVVSVLKMALRLTLPATVIEKRRERREREHSARHGIFL